MEKNNQRAKKKFEDKADTARRKILKAIWQTQFLGKVNRKKLNNALLIK